MIPVFDENATRNVPLVTIALIALSFVFFVISPVARAPILGREPSTAQLCSQQAYFLRWGSVPKELMDNQQLRYMIGPAAGDHLCATPPPTYRKNLLASTVTALFVHAGWLHLLGNMLFLWVFGNNVEDRFGRLRFLLFYLLVGMAATYGYAVTQPDSEAPLVGASGAIAGVLGAYLVLFPKAKVTTLIIVVPVRLAAWIVLGLWFVLQAIYARGAGLTGQTDVGYLVHVIGFVLGVGYGLVQRRRYRRLPPHLQWHAPIPPP